MQNRRGCYAQPFRGTRPLLQGNTSAAPALTELQGHWQVEGPNTGPAHGSLPGPNTGHDAWAVATSPHDSSTANMAFFTDNLLVND